MSRAKLLGFEIDKYTFDELSEIADKGQVVTINPEMIEYASRNPEFVKIIQDAEYVIPDGIGVQLGLTLTGEKVRRIAGVDFAKQMLRKFETQPIALIGAKPHIIKKAAENLKKELPNLNLVYVQDGYFEDEAKILEEVRDKNPKLILAALGSPKQEEFIYKLKKDLPDTLMIGVGGSFDVWSGEVERAPEIYQKIGLEWLYRTVKDPKRFKRIFPALPVFMFKVLRYGANNVR